MHVPVVDARHERAAAELDDLGARSYESAGTAVRADVRDAPAGHGDRLGNAVAGHG